MHFLEQSCMMKPPCCFYLGIPQKEMLQHCIALVGNIDALLNYTFN